MLSKQILRIILVGIGLGSVAALVHTAGPFIDIGGFRPLENVVVRQIVIVLLAAAFASGVGFHLWRRRQGAKKIAKTMGAEGAEESDEPILKERMKDALTTLKNASGGRANYLYDLPWYILIGPPGAGKTTALVNSGLQFPLARGRPAAIAGVGGTRYCDWWFTEDAVLIDTAGRYTTQDSDAKADQKSWFAFLDTLKKGRPKQPINGVLLAISVEDLLTLKSAELAAHAQAIRARLLELHTHLKVDFPVYAVFTKTDLIKGFAEYFQSLGEVGRRQVFGVTFQTADKTKNMIGDIPEEFDALVARLNEEMADRLQEEPAPVTRTLLYGFPTQMETLKRSVFDFLNQIFEPTRYHVNATLRGFYFTSGTQEGTPIDQLIGALERSFGTVEVPQSAYSGGGKSYFLTDLIKKVIIGEAAWVSTDWAAVRRAAILRACSYAAIVLVAVGISGLWWVSYARNRALIAATDDAVGAINAANAKKAEESRRPAPLQENSIADRDFGRVVALLDRFRSLPAGYAARGEGTPIAETFGLSQRGRLQSSAVSSYHAALERIFRPRLLYRLEERLEADQNDPGLLYQELKVYLMLGGLHKLDRALVADWLRRDWADKLYPGEGNEAGRADLEGHLQAMFDLDEGEKPLVDLSGPLLEDSQAKLARMSLAERAYQLLKSRAVAGPEQDWVLTRDGGLQVASVFEPTGNDGLQSIRIPYFYTYAGFHRAFLPKLADVANQLDQEQWVLGKFAQESSFKGQYATLGKDLLALYSRDFIAAWQGMLSKIKLKRFTGDKAFITLTAAAAPNSPIKQLFEAVVAETAVTKARPGFDEKKPAPAAGGAGAGTGETSLSGPGQDAGGGAATPPLFSTGAGEKTPGADIEAAFRGFQDMLTGDPGNRPIDQLLATLKKIEQDEKDITTNPSQAGEKSGDLQAQVRNLGDIAASLPAPFSDQIRRAAASFDNDRVNATHDTLQQDLGEVSQTCTKLVQGKYPFAAGARDEVGLTDFGKVFGPNGVLDQYFSKNLDKYVEKGGKAGWGWKAGDPVGRTLSADALRSFQRAAQIREAFFPQGGIQPSFTLNVTMPNLASGETGQLEFYGSTVASQAGSSLQAPVQWPGAGSYQIKFTLTTQATTLQPASDTEGSKPATPAPAAPAPAPAPDVQTFIPKSGVWALFRLIDDYQATKPPHRITLNANGHDLRLQFQATSSADPLNLAMLRDFRCPTRI